MSDILTRLYFFCYFRVLPRRVYDSWLWYDNAAAWHLAGIVAEHRAAERGRR